MREWYKTATPVQLQSMSIRNTKTRLVRQYGITFEQYLEMLKKQAGECAICENQMRQPHIDHDHSTGRVRGLLCATCNTAVGKLERPGWLEAASCYLGDTV